MNELEERLRQRAIINLDEQLDDRDLQELLERRQMKKLYNKVDESQLRDVVNKQSIRRIQDSTAPTTGGSVEVPTPPSSIQSFDLPPEPPIQKQEVMKVPREMPVLDDGKVKIGRHPQSEGLSPEKMAELEAEAEAEAMMQLEAEAETPDVVTEKEADVPMSIPFKLGLSDNATGTAAVRGVQKDLPDYDVKLSNEESPRIIVRKKGTQEWQPINAEGFSFADIGENAVLGTELGVSALGNLGALPTAGLSKPVEMAVNAGIETARQLGAKAFGYQDEFNTTNLALAAAGGAIIPAARKVVKGGLAAARVIGAAASGASPGIAKKYGDVTFRKQIQNLAKSPTELYELTKNTSRNILKQVREYTAPIKQQYQDFVKVADPVRTGLVYNKIKEGYKPVLDKMEKVASQGGAEDVQNFKKLKKMYDGFQIDPGVGKKGRAFIDYDTLDSKIKTLDSRIKSSTTELSKQDPLNKIKTNINKSIRKNLAEIKDTVLKQTARNKGLPEDTFQNINNSYANARHIEKKAEEYFGELSSVAKTTKDEHTLLKTIAATQQRPNEVEQQAMAVLKESGAINNPKIREQLDLLQGLVLFKQGASQVPELGLPYRKVRAAAGLGETLTDPVLDYLDAVGPRKKFGIKNIDLATRLATGALKNTNKGEE